MPNATTAEWLPAFGGWNLRERPMRAARSLRVLKTRRCIDFDGAAPELVESAAQLC